ncbi:unnamed protein product [Linum tenue]|uniref:C2H2-type domain-containing protein n=1 Tax=Linum tenue TaxID=586396 RepID=A0AAV0MIC8_9ROSI|nr:unnamed protein product [Linum tenue]
MSNLSDPSAEVVALSPTTLMATNRFVCEICNKGFQRDQNLQLHRRGHNLPWKLKQRSTTEVRKRVYICPESSCVHHNPARALGDLTGIKKHFSRKHGEKKWKCDKCSKKYAVQSDWKAHHKTCGTREYKCDCGTIFSRRDSFITHRAFCDALAEENNKVNQGQGMMTHTQQMPDLMPTSNFAADYTNHFEPKKSLPQPQDLTPTPFKPMNVVGGMFSTTSGTLFGGPRNMSSSTSSATLHLSSNAAGASSSSGFGYLQDGSGKGGPQIPGSAHMSATALLQKAAQMGATTSNNSPMMHKGFAGSITAGGAQDQMAPIPRPQHSQPILPSYSGTQQQLCHPNPYDHHFSSQPDHQTNIAGLSGGGGGSPTAFMQKTSQEMSQLFDAATGGSSMNDMGMFASIFMAGDHHSPAPPVGFSKSLGLHQDNLSGGGSRFGSELASDVTTRDFMGVGGSTPANLQEQQQQRLEIEALSQQQQQQQQRMAPTLNNYQQQLSLGEAGLDKPIWDV